MSSKAKPTAPAPKTLRQFIIDNKDFIEAISLLTTAFIAFISAVLYYYSSEKSANFQAEVVANETWERYRQIGFENEDLVRGRPDYAKLDDDRQLKYAHLVERLLMAADLIAITAQGDTEWRAAFEIELLRHKSYILDDDFLIGKDGSASEYCTYRKAARAWIAYPFKKRNAGQKIDEAERKCVEQGYTN